MTKRPTPNQMSDAESFQKNNSPLKWVGTVLLLVLFASLAMAATFTHPDQTDGQSPEATEASIPTLEPLPTSPPTVQAVATNTPEPTAEPSPSPSPSPSPTPVPTVSGTETSTPESDDSGFPTAVSTGTPVQTIGASRSARGASFELAAADCAPGPGKELSGCIYNGLDLRGSDFSGSNLAGATFNGADISGSNFAGANMAAATLNGANVSGSNFNNATLTAATLNGANLSSSNFSGANLTAATIDGATLLGSTLTGAILTSATWDATTICPDGTGAGAVGPICVGHLDPSGPEIPTATPTATATPVPTVVPTVVPTSIPTAVPTPTATPNFTSIELVISPNPAGIGAPITGQATLFGATLSAGGSVTYTGYIDDICLTVIASSQGSTVTVVNGISPASTAFSYDAAGTVFWNASYSGDANNLGAVSQCNALTVRKAAPALTLLYLPNPVSIGDTFQAHMELSSDAVDPAGSVTLSSFIDSACITPFSGIQPYTVQIADGVIADPAPVVFDFARAIYAQAMYSGDANNEAAASSCLPIAIEIGSLTASVSAATFMPIDYSQTATVNSGQFVLTVTDERGTAAGWSLSLSGSALLYNGASPAGIAIPSQNLSVTSVGAPTLLWGQPIGPGGPQASQDSPGTLDQSRTIATTSEGYGTGAYEFTLSVAIQIPAASQVGIYTGTVVVLIAAAP